MQAGALEFEEELGNGDLDKNTNIIGGCFMDLRQLTERVFYSMYNKEADRPILGYINGKKK